MHLLQRIQFTITKFSMKKIRRLKGSQRLIWLSFIGSLAMSTYSHGNVNKNIFTHVSKYSESSILKEIGGKVISAKDS